ncbi:MAG: biopolymer transporter ExbD [Phycisphaerales bacterium]|nr:biopolymer transporter ExbD [Phycisphaerales bacterium]
MDRLALNLASMIDVTFLLLVYFIVSTVMARPEDQLTSSIQTRDSETSGAEVDYQPQVIEVVQLKGRSTYIIGDRMLHDLPSLTRVLEDLPKEIGVFVRVSPGIPVEFALAAVQSARDAGFQQVTYVPQE